MEKKLDQTRIELYSNLSRWERVELARHPQRPNTHDYIKQITEYIQVVVLILTIFEPKIQT